MIKERVVTGIKGLSGVGLLLPQSKRKQRKRRRRRKKRAPLRKTLKKGRDRWCRVSSQALNTTVVWTWAHALEEVKKRRGSVLDARRSARKPWKKKRKRKSVVLGAQHRGYKHRRNRRTDYAAWRVRRKATKRRKRKRTKTGKKRGVHVRREGKGQGSKVVRKQRMELKIKVKRKSKVKFKGKRKKKMKRVKKVMVVRSVSDRTRESHNGCQGKKQRRR